MVRQDGLTGMYRGLGPPVCMMMLMNSMNFTAFYQIKEKFYAYGGTKNPGNAEVGWGTKHGGIDWRVVGAATAVGPLCAVISTPFELVKLQLQLDSANHGSRRKYINSMDAAQQLFRRYGPRIFYLGHGVNTVRECVFHGIFFSTYEHINHGLHREVGLSKPIAVAAAGGIAGALAWAGNLPLDCVKSGVQGQCLGNGGWDGWRAKVGSMQSARDVLARGGFSGFYSGATPSILRAFVVSGSRFAAFSSGMALFEGLRQHTTSLAEEVEREVERDL